MTKLTEQQIQEATRLRILQALAFIQEAQHHLGSACQMLSALEHGHASHQRVSKLHDQVKDSWYAVERLLKNPKVRLDALNIATLERMVGKND